MTVNTIYIKEVDSTNRWLRDYQPATDEELTVVWTDYQTAGRGCGSNTWESEEGKNLTFSVLIRPQAVPAKDQFILSMANALALKETLDSYVDGITIKWPNDIYWHDRKICGTLIETSLRGSDIKDCIIGTGLNVNQQQFVSDAPNPVSLAQILGQEIDRKEVLHQVIARMDALFTQVAQGTWTEIRSRYRDALYRKGEVHSYRYPDGTEEQLLLLDVTDDGYLLLLQPQRGELLSFAFKEIAFTYSPSKTELESETNKTE
jgi:BirA family biotin operon repressor/biotin-[acetyl-CoA-carboxylase] ligase